MPTIVNSVRVCVLRINPFFVPVVPHPSTTSVRADSLTLLELQSHFGGNTLKFQVLCPQIGTAVLKGLKVFKDTWYRRCRVLVLRGTMVNRTYGIHKNIYIIDHFYQQYLVLLTMVPRK